MYAEINHASDNLVIVFSGEFVHGQMLRKGDAIYYVMQQAVPVYCGDGKADREKSVGRTFKRYVRNSGKGSSSITYTKSEPWALCFYLYYMFRNKTNDNNIATVDEDGYYSIVGRIKDMIIRGGENIYPREIEEFLYSHECVQDVHVAGIPDEKYGELVGAFIMKKEGFNDVTEADIRDFCIGSIARYKVPKYVFFVDEFPLTTSGKIQKYKLGELGLALLDERC